MVQAGNEEVQNRLLKAYQPFVAKSVSDVCKRYIDPQIDDEFSVGLLAFNEAMLSYSADKGSSFLSFARLVVKRRVIDYIRQEQTKTAAASIDEPLEDAQLENPSEVNAAKAIYQDQVDSWYRREEIRDLQDKLKEYKLSFEELTVISPKHRDARESAIRVARVLYENEFLRSYVLKKRKIPIKNLVNYVDVSKKTLERNRKFILAIFIILSGDYIYLKDYLKGLG
ncbi:RNA polymerase sigma-I factor [Sediminibacillus dalangtanensis]|uniref:RNA polymerase sigma factor SigI n=2 Tax=Sediminibacillus dalangtanensis TaxID=2729421 RepID=A0ABX7VZX7_9BACI|nr:RNA polymerase sigma-I factor [Sediminibacillus dalangtanensis]QTN01376.1 RNA polymerase sigma-I factor [Sediminibacillus dalangtanensis]